MLSHEQKQALEAVARATGVDLLALIAKAEAESEKLESLGIAYKARKKPHGYGLGDFIRQSREAVAKATESTKVAPAKPTLPKVLDAALAAANANAMGDPGILGSTIKRATTKASPKPSELSDANEAIAQQLAMTLTEQYIRPIREFLADRAIVERLADAARRLDVLEGKKAPPPGFLGGDTRRRGSEFNWSAFDSQFLGRRPRQ